MIELAAYGLIAFMGIFIMPRWSVQGYDTPRQTLVTVAGFGILAWAILAGPSALYGRMLVLWPMLAAWILATALSDRADLSIETGLSFVFCMVAGLTAAGDPGSRAGLAMIAGAGTLTALYAILQKHFHVNLFPKLEWDNPHGACGFTRNTNFTGPWLALTTVFTAKLGFDLAGIERGLILLIAGVQVYAILIGRCRTAYLGLGAAITYLGFTAPIGIWAHLGPSLWFAFMVASIDRLKTLDLQSLKERRAYFKIFREAFKSRPWTGYGFNVLKTQVPYIQRDINKATGGEFLKPANYANPVVRKVHNDLLQHILDVGFIGAGVTLAVLYRGISRPEPFSMAVLIAFAIMGLTFHQSYWLPTQCLFWFAWGSMTGPVGPETVPTAPALFGLGLIGILIARTTIMAQVFDFVAWTWANDPKQPTRALEAAVNARPNSLFLFHLGNQFAKEGRSPAAIEALNRAIERYDGEGRMWVICAGLGEAYLLAGSLVLSRHYHELALSFYPEWTYSRRRLEWLDHVKTVPLKEAQHA